MVRRALGPGFGAEAVEHDSAHARAEDLLRDSLTRADFDRYRRSGYVDIESALHPGRVYRVDGWRPVAVFEGGDFVGAICIRPREHMPGPDVILARKLLIEGAERDFLESGNWLSPAWRPASAVPTLLLVLIVLLPWLARVPQFGLVGLALVVAVPLAFVVTSVRRRSAGARAEGRGDRSGPADVGPVREVGL